MGGGKLAEQVVVQPPRMHDQYGAAGPWAIGQAANGRCQGICTVVVRGR